MGSARDLRDARRGRWLQWLWIVGALCALTVLGGALWRAWAHVRPALPEGWSGNPTILIEGMEALSLDVGTPLLATEPMLTRWGEVYEAIDPHSLRIGIKPEHFLELRDDAELVVVERSLGELELLSAFFQGERWQRSLERLELWWEREQPTLRGLRDLLRNELSARFGAADAEALIKDPALQAACWQALQAEVLERVDWAEVASASAETEAVRELGQWVSSEAQLELVMQRASGAFLSHLWNEIAAIPSALWNDPLGTATNVGPKTKRGLARASRGTAEDVLEGALSSLARGISDDPDHALRIALEAGEAVATEAELESHLRDAWHKFLADTRVVQKVSALEADGFSRLQDALRALSKNPEVLQHFEHLARSLGSMASAIVRELALDASGRSWNPLLLALLRERLLGRRTPMIVVVDPGRGNRVAPGTVFGVITDPGALW